MSKLSEGEAQILRQDNFITRSRHDFNALEQDALVLIVDKIQRLYHQHTEAMEHRIETKQSIRITLTLDEYSFISNPVNRAIRAFKVLCSKPIYIGQEAKTFKESWFVYAPYISSFIKEKGSSDISVEVSSALLPYYVNFIKNNKYTKYTKYDAKVILSLSSAYSKRFYQLGASWRHQKHFEYTIENLREMFNLENTYKKNSDFSLKVVERPLEEIEELYRRKEAEGTLEETDFYLTYNKQYKKSKRGRPTLVGFEFFIRKHTDNLSEETDKAIGLIDITLRRYFPKDKGLLSNAMAVVQSKEAKEENIPIRIANKLNRIFQGENIQNKPAVMRTMLKRDFNIVTSGPSKATKKYKAKKRKKDVVKVDSAIQGALDIFGISNEDL